MAQIVNKLLGDTEGLKELIDNPSESIARFTLMEDDERFMLGVLVSSSSPETIFQGLLPYQAGIVMPSEDTPFDVLVASLAASDIVFQTLTFVAIFHGSEAAEDMQERLHQVSPIKGLPPEMVDHITQRFKERREARHRHGN